MNYQDKVVTEEGDRVIVGDLIKLDPTNRNNYVAENGARAVVINMSSDDVWVRVKWVDKKEEGKRHREADGGYLSKDFKLIERMGKAIGENL